MGFEAATSPQSRSSIISGSKLGTQKSEADHRERERENRDTVTDTNKERETERDSLWSPPLSWQRWAFDGLLRIWLMNFTFQIWGFNIDTAVAVVRVVADRYTFVVHLSFLGFEVEGREESRGEQRRGQDWVQKEGRRRVRRQCSSSHKITTGPNQPFVFYWELWIFEHLPRSFESCGHGCTFLLCRVIRCFIMGFFILFFLPRIRCKK